MQIQYRPSPSLHLPPFPNTVLTFTLTSPSPFPNTGSTRPPLHLPPSQNSTRAECPHECQFNCDILTLTVIPTKHYTGVHPIITGRWFTHGCESYFYLTGRELASAADSELPTESAASIPVKSPRKMITQGQADMLNMTQLKEHTTLTFEIAEGEKKVPTEGK